MIFCLRVFVPIVSTSHPYIVQQNISSCPLQLLWKCALYRKWFSVCFFPEHHKILHPPFPRKNLMQFCCCLNHTIQRVLFPFLRIMRRPQGPMCRSFHSNPAARKRLLFALLPVPNSNHLP